MRADDGSPAATLLTPSISTTVRSPVGRSVIKLPSKFSRRGSPTSSRRQRESGRRLRRQIQATSCSRRFGMAPGKSTDICIRLGENASRVSAEPAGLSDCSSRPCRCMFASDCPVSAMAQRRGVDSGFGNQGVDVGGWRLDPSTGEVCWSPAGNPLCRPLPIQVRAPMPFGRRTTLTPSVSPAPWTVQTVQTERPAFPLSG